MKVLVAPLRACVLILVYVFCVAAQIPSPKDVLGFTPGDDRKLASWPQVVDYFKKLDAASDRMKFEEIGKSTMGAPFVYATISSPENLRNLAKYNEINKKLADPRKLRSRDTQPAPEVNAAAVQRLIRDGKTIVLITFGIHSTEVGSYLSSMLVAHELASSNSARVKKVLDETIILLVPSLNPDGVDIVKNWYDKTLGTPYEGTNPPELYHKYVGHDLNRDWYAFTQVETQLTVDKIHNVWRPHIVLDVHQQGIYGARQFVPPYMPPVEPNVPKQIVEGFTELGTYIANDLRKNGFQGITSGTTYDAWTPARAYSHYHGGVRILSETASARLATPVEVKFEQLGTSPGGLDAKVESPNFGPVWKGGTWKLRNITDYMTATAFSLLDHAANNRQKWLTNFYEIGKEAVRPRKEGEIGAYIIPDNERYNEFALRGLLERAGVEIEEVRAFTHGGRKFKDQTTIVKLDQPYGAFVQALLSKTIYPNLLDDSGKPINPYDVTAHNISLLFGAETIAVPHSFRFRKFIPKADTLPYGPARGAEQQDKNTFSVCVYRSFIPSMDEGWTRWVLEEERAILRNRMPYSTKVEIRSVTNPEINKNLANLCNTIIFPDQSAGAILDGYSKGSMPDEFVGGLRGEGVQHLRSFIENGRTALFLNRSSTFAIEQLRLPLRNPISGSDPKAFFIPGSILKIEFDDFHPIATQNSRFLDQESRSWNQLKESIAWFEHSPVFEIERQETGAMATSPVSGLQSPVLGVKIIGRYPSDPKNILLSGWALGQEKIAGKAALVEVGYGKGKIILFGFRPQYRGQSLATFPLLFNAIAQ